MVYLFVFIFGLVFGSFISVITWRVPRRISFVKGRSMCPRCKRQISWFDNIPLFSFIFLKGRCRYCKRKISPRYPFIEFVTGMGFITIYHLFSVENATTFSLLVALFLFILFFSIFVIDLENQIIPDSMTFSGAAVYFVYLIFSNQSSIFTSLFAGFLAATFLLVIHLLTKGKGMGLGDVKFAFFGGMIMGINYLPYWFLASFVTGAVAGITLMLIGKAKMKTRIAFGPFLVIGMAITFLLKNYITAIFNLI